MPKQTLKICCPKCNEVIHASIQDSYRDFIIMVCPKCHKNVVYYDNKVDIISDRLVKKLISKRHLQFCGVVENGPLSTLEHGSDKGLTNESMLDLKILLETSQDVNDFLSKI